MKPAPDCRIVVVTAPDRRTARKLARLALEQRSAACVNLIPRVESQYWWQGKLEKSAEVLMVFKTTKRRLGALERLVLENHPYDTAEFVALTPGAVTERYLKWWQAEVEVK